MPQEERTEQGYQIAACLEEKAVRIVTSINKSALIGRSWSDEKLELIKLFSDYVVDTNITPTQIAEMYLSRQRKFVAGDFTIRYNPKVSDVEGNCQWPLGCGWSDGVQRDHILPKSAFHDGVNFLYSEELNTMPLCPTHNSILKGNHIATGLWLRGMI